VYKLWLADGLTAVAYELAVYDLCWPSGLHRLTGRKMHCSRSARPTAATGKTRVGVLRTNISTRM